MNSNASTPRGTVGLLMALGCTIPFASCRQEKPRSEIVQIEGRVEKIDARSDGTGTISVRYRNEKQGQDVVGTGQVTNETEIMINGAAAKLADLGVGELVRGEIRVEKSGQDRRMVALRVYAERATVQPPGAVSAGD